MTEPERQRFTPAQRKASTRKGRAEPERGAQHDDLSVASDLAAALMLIGPHRPVYDQPTACGTCGLRWPCPSYRVLTAAADAIVRLTARGRDRDPPT